MSTHAVTLFLIVAVASCLTGQPVKAQYWFGINPEAINNCEQYKVNVKGGTIFKPEFGDYKVIKAKRRFSDEVKDSKAAELLNTSSGWNKTHFYLTHASGRNMVVNQSLVDSRVHKQRVVNDFFEIGDDGISFGKQWSRVSIIRQSLFASIIDKADDSEWLLSLVNIREEIEEDSDLDDDRSWLLRFNTGHSNDSTIGERSFNGVLTNGDIQIAIKEGVEIKSGGLLPQVAKWFEFYLDDQLIGAVTIDGFTVNKIHVFLHKELQEGMEAKLAAAMAIIISNQLST